MADNWFGDNVFQVVVPRRLLEAPELTTELNTDLTDALAALDAGESTALPIWDAMA